MKRESVLRRKRMSGFSLANNPKFLVAWLVVNVSAIVYAAYSKEWVILGLLCLTLPFDLLDAFKVVRR